MKCEGCGAEMKADRQRGLYVCDYCGAELDPPPEADGVLVLGDSTEDCPICGRRLSDGSLQMYAIKFCTGCRGMLVGMDRFLLLVEAQRSHRNPFPGRIERRSLVDAERHLRCPSCGSAMNAYPYGGGGNVNIDSCEKCGLVWLDGGEMRRIAAAPHHNPSYGN